MAEEIERKFLVRDDSWRPGEPGVEYCQGYLSTEPERTVRVRVAGSLGFLTIKGKSRGITRAEFEFPIPRSDAEQLLQQLCLRPLVEKTRYTRHWGGHTWVIDEFAGENRGLVLAEVELSRADEALQLPPWAGAEVSEDPRYYNANLIARPYASW